MLEALRKRLGTLIYDFAVLNYCLHVDRSRMPGRPFLQLTIEERVVDGRLSTHRLLRVEEVTKHGCFGEPLQEELD